MSKTRRQPSSSTFEILDAVFNAPEFFELELTATPWNGQGRPRKYPAAFAMIYKALDDHFHSWARTNAEIAHPVVWKYICVLWAKTWPTLPKELRKALPRTLPSGPYQKYHYVYAVKTWLDPDIVNAKLAKLSLRAANATGRLTGGDTLTTPDPSNILTGDTTTIRPLAGKGTKHEDPDAGKWFHGGVVDESYTDGALPSGVTEHYGIEHSVISLSTLGEIQLIFSTAPVPKRGQEVHTLHRLVDDLVPTIQADPAATLRGFIYDKAVHGVDIDRVQRKHGIIMATTKSKGTEASPNVKSVPYKTWDGVQIRFEEGRPVAYELDVNGRLVRTKDQPERLQVKRRQNADGEWRFSVGYLYRGVTHWIRASNRDSDHYSQCENFRILDNQTLFETGIGGYRNTAENVNRQLKRNLPDGRARSKGARRQRFDIMGRGFKNAALAILRSQAATGPPTAVAEAA